MKLELGDEEFDAVKFALEDIIDVYAEAEEQNVRDTVPALDRVLEKMRQWEAK